MQSRFMLLPLSVPDDLVDVPRCKVQSRRIRLAIIRGDRGPCPAASAHWPVWIRLCGRRRI